MSKMLKLMNKAKAMKDSRYSMAFQSDHVAAEDVESPKMNSTNGEYPTENGQFENGHSERPGFSIALMILVVIVAATSLFVSSRALLVMNSRNDTKQYLTEKLSEQNANMIQLEELMSELSETEIAKIEALEKELDQLGRVIKTNQAEVQNLVGNYHLLEKTIDDLNTSDRLMLKKFIAMNQKIREIDGKVRVTNTLKEEGRDL